MTHTVFVIGFSLVTLVLFWLPFFLGWQNVHMDRIVANFDGVNFLVVAKTAYDPHTIEVTYADILAGRNPRYFAAHYPLWPAVIAFFDIFTSGPTALLISIVFANAFLAASLYLFFDELFPHTSKSVWLTIASLLIPARILAVRGVGSNEMLFIALTLWSIVAYRRKQLWLSAGMGALAVLTRSPGIVLYGAYGLVLLLEKISWRQKLLQLLPYTLIPVALVGLWFYYGWRLGSFWAYFQVGGNINLYYPFSVFTTQSGWVGDIWLEDIVYMIMFMVGGLYGLIRRSRLSILTIYASLYSLFVLCVAHRDIARYALPVFPLLLVGWSEVIPPKMQRLILFTLLIPTFLYAWQFVMANYQPITDWSRFL
jgi:hypothetical protein